MRSPFDLLRRLWGELPIYLYAAVCGAVCLALWAAHGVRYDHAGTSTSFTIFYVSAMMMFGIDLLWQLATRRPARPIRFLRDRYLSRRAALGLLGGIPALALCVVMIPIFSSMKSMIPLFADYSWDATFIAWDRAIFFGHDAWRIMQPLLGYPLVSAGIAVSYHVWILFLYPGCIYFAFYPDIDRDTRRRFFLSYALSWSLVGGLIATLFASVGPVFAEQLAGIDTFRPQMDYLRAANQQVPIMTLPVQEMLVERFHADQRGLGSGITAMPSMHVAVAALFWLALRDVSPRAGKVFFWYFVLIWIGSVHTAYHYAVDGLVSLVAVATIWWASKRIFAWWDRLPAPLFAQPALRTNTAPAE